MFEKKYGIKVEAPDIGGDEVLLKTKEEQKAGAFYNDVWAYSSSAAGDLIGELLPKQYVWRFVPDELVAVTPDSALNPVLSVSLRGKGDGLQLRAEPQGLPDFEHLGSDRARLERQDVCRGS